MPKGKQRKETRKKGKRTEEGSCCSVLNFFHPSPLVGWDFLLLPPPFSLFLVPSHRREDFWFINDGFGFVRVSNLSRRHRASITAPILTHPLPGYLLRLSLLLVFLHNATIFSSASRGKLAKTCECEFEGVRRRGGNSLTETSRGKWEEGCLL